MRAAARRLERGDIGDLHSLCQVKERGTARK